MTRCRGRLTAPVLVQPTIDWNPSEAPLSKVANIVINY
jgi:hypothetical protein